MSPSKLLATVFKSELDVFLDAQGYRRCDFVYYDERAGLTALIDIQRSRWSDRSEAQFTLNGGIFVPGIVSSYLRQEDPRQPTLADCCVSVRIGMLDQSRLDRWWKATASAGEGPIQISAVAIEVREHVDRLLLPFLAKFQTPSEVANFLAEPISPATRFIAPQAASLRYAYASLIYSRNGDQSLAHEAYANAMREAQGMPNEVFVKRLSSFLNP